MDGYFLSGSLDHFVRVLDIRRRKEAFGLSHQGSVLAIAVSSDSRHVATGGLDETLRVFELDDHSELIRLPHRAPVKAVVFSPDGRCLLAASVRIGSAPSRADFTLTRHLLNDDLVSEACARLTRNLTREEWFRYFGKESYKKTCPQLP